MGVMDVAQMKVISVVKIYAFQKLCQKQKVENIFKSQRINVGDIHMKLKNVIQSRNFIISVSLQSILCFVTSPVLESKKEMIWY